MIEMVAKKSGKPDLTEIAFGDDGIGMSTDTLFKCLQLGFSKRYNDRSGIGRFGVGMTLGAITQCTRIEVYSKPKGGNWNMTYLDLDELKDLEAPLSPQPRPAEIPENYAKLTGDHGTLVVWKNWDREDAKIEEIEEWIGRTYRKFIGNQIITDSNNVIDNPNKRNIFLYQNDSEKEISALDPLYVIKTEYDSKTAELAEPIILEEQVHLFDPPKNPPLESEKITIRLSLLPESWRSKRGEGNSKENRKRKVPKNEGISILRNNREVFYGHIPYYRITDTTSEHYKGFIDMDRFWGCEISFNANLDHWFSVKNVKVGARPVKELREKIQEYINPTIKSYREEIRKTWKTRSDEHRRRTKGAVENEDPAEEIISTTVPSKPADSKEIDKLIRESGERQEEIIKAITEKINKNPLAFKKEYTRDERGNFIDIISRGGKTIININMKHPFFRKFYDLLEIIKDDSKQHTKDDLAKITEELDVNVKLLLGSLALSEREINKEQEQLAGDVLDKLHHSWTFYLEKLTKQTLESNEN